MNVVQFVVATESFCVRSFPGARWSQNTDLKMNMIRKKGEVKREYRGEWKGKEKETGGKKRKEKKERRKEGRKEGKAREQ